MKKRYWTDAEVKELTELAKTMSFSEISKKMNRSRAGIKGKADRLGIEENTNGKSFGGRLWTDEDIITLKNMSKNHSYSEIANKLERTLVAITFKAREIGIEQTNLQLLSKKEYENSGIYSINNIKTGQKYIGQSVNVKTRWYQHKSKLNNVAHANKFLQDSYTKYGEDNFEFVVLEDCHVKKLNDREKYYISLFDSTNRTFGFNIDDGGRVGDNEHMKKVSVNNGRKNAKPIYQIDFKGNIVNYWEYGCNQAGKELGFSHAHIQKVLKGTTSTSYGFIWLYEEDYNKETFNQYDYLDKSKKYNPVVQLTMDGEYVNEYLQLIKAADSVGGDRKGIYACLNKGRESHRNFKWISARDYYSKKTI